MSCESYNSYIESMRGDKGEQSQEQVTAKPKTCVPLTRNGDTRTKEHLTMNNCSVGHLSSSCLPTNQSSGSCGIYPRCKPRIIISESQTQELMKSFKRKRYISAFIWHSKSGRHLGRYATDHSIGLDFDPCYHGT